MASTDPKLYKVDREARRERKAKRRPSESLHIHVKDGERTELVRVLSATPAEVEARQFVADLARNYAACVEWYRSEQGGKLAHAEAVAAEDDARVYRRSRVEAKDVKEITWSELSAVGDVSTADALALWAKICDEADDALASGLRAGEVIGAASPYERAEFLAIRDAFADEWQPRGGIESAMIDQMAVAFSQQMYWTAISHARATRMHNEQRKELRRFESAGWKSPYQSEADAIEQAYRLADGYNRQFLRVLRQLRDLRRYAPPVIVNNGGQVNVAANGGQQVNVTQPEG